MGNWGFHYHHHLEYRRGIMYLLTSAAWPPSMAGVILLDAHAAAKRAKKIQATRERSAMMTNSASVVEMMALYKAGEG